MERRWEEHSASAVGREAVRILTKIADHLHVVTTAASVHIESDISHETFDRLCLWNSAHADLEDADVAEDGVDTEEEYGM